MYKERFRNRNSAVGCGSTTYENYINSGTCTSPNWHWSPYGTDVFSGTFGVIDTIDDIAGDPPNLKAGKVGYKFHPFTRVKVEATGGGNPLWTVRNKSVQCAGQPGQDYILYRPQASNANYSLAASGLSYPFAADGIHLELGSTPYPQSIISTLLDESNTECLSKRGTFGESNLYESLAEIDKTLGLLHDILRNAHRIQSAIFSDRSLVNKIRALSDVAAGQYLLTRYGFKPLLSDIMSVLSGLDRPLGRMLVKTRTSRQWTNQQTFSLADVTQADTITYTRSKTITQSVRVRSLSLDEAEVTMLNAMGLSGKDFLSVPYELMRFSFVLDWVVNLGDFLRACVPALGLSTIGGCNVVEWSCLETVSYGVKGVRSGKESIIEIISATPPPACSRSILYKSRSSSLFNPSLTWKSDLKLDNLVRCLDILALLKQQVSGFRRQVIFPPMPVRRKMRRPGKKGDLYFLPEGHAAHLFLN